MRVAKGDGIEVAAGIGNDSGTGAGAERVAAPERVDHGRAKSGIALQVSTQLLPDGGAAPDVIIQVQGSPETGLDPLHQVKFSGGNRVLFPCRTHEFVVVAEEPRAEVGLNNQVGRTGQITPVASLKTHRFELALMTLSAS